MNPFKSRKKSDGPDGLDEPPPSTTRSRTFRRKKIIPEPKKELDITNALPSLDNFRTSLLMPNLSARFSMLRNQDDPNSKIGKANDDSVLFPKRYSRLDLFGHATLSDIAEVSSLHSTTFRPPFADFRHESYASTDGYGTDDDSLHGGSVMSRAKPGQGNKFFGGRQKIYKIPLGDAPASDPGTPDHGKPMGKAMYDDDISLSAFQALRLKEKEGRHTPDVYPDSIFGDIPFRDTDGGRSSPSLMSYNRKRETSSSTNSGAFDPRTSTAATSMTSQSASSTYASHVPPSAQMMATSKQSPLTSPSPIGFQTKNKRLYGHGLDQQMHEQQSSAMNRLNSIQRGHTGFSPNMQTRSATNLNDRYQRGLPLYASTNFRAASPPPSSASTNGLAGFDFGVTEERVLPSTSRDNEPGFGRSPPLSPPRSPDDDAATFVAALEPNDVGKATASGAFNKPKTQYNEQQFAQRQLQLQEGRGTPSPRYSEGSASARMRNGSVASAQSGLAHQLAGQDSAVVRNQTLHSSPEANGVPHTTFLESMSGSEYDSDEDEKPKNAAPTSSPPHSLASQQAAPTDSIPRHYAHDDQHPAFSSASHQDSFTMRQNQSNHSSNDESVFYGGNVNGHNAMLAESEDYLDVPASTETAGGLSDLIKGHLRNHSGASSYYPPSSPRQTGGDAFSDGAEHGEHLDGAKHASSGHVPAEEPMPVHLSLRARQILEQATQLKKSGSKAQQVLGTMGVDKAQQLLGDEAPRLSGDSVSYPWQDQVKSQHSRGGSTETQREREDFANELADRRRKVQDNMKSYVRAESRSSSPNSSNRSINDAPTKSSAALGILKKTSIGSLSGRGDQQASKAMKMLGINPGPPIRNPSSHPAPLESGRVGDGQTARGTTGQPLNAAAHPSSQIPISPRTTAGTGPSFKDRSIAAERREKFNSDRRSPHTSRTPVREMSGTINQQGAPAPPSFLTRSHGEPVPPMQQPMSYHPAGRARKYSPPRPTRADKPEIPLDQAPEFRSQSVPGARPQVHARPSVPPPSGPPPSHSPPRAPGQVSNGIRAPRGMPNAPAYSQQGAAYPAQGPAYPPQGQVQPGPIYPPQAPVQDISSRHAVPPQLEVSSMVPGPTMILPSQSFSPRSQNFRKQLVNKSDISEPTFISATSSITTVDLPPGASLSNGMDEVRAEALAEAAAASAAAAPPVPRMDPRRRRPRDMFTAFSSSSSGRSGRGAASPENVDDNFAARRYGSLPYHPTAESDAFAAVGNYNSYDDQSTFSADDAEAWQKPARLRLRKTSSDGISAAKAQARHQALMAPSPLTVGDGGAVERMF